MKNYQYHSAEEFLMDEWFLAWVKHDQPEARLFWQQWQQQNPARRDTVLLAKDMAEALINRPHPLTVDQQKQEVEQIMKLTRHLPQKTRWSIFINPNRTSRWLAAAIVLLLLGLGWSLWQPGRLVTPKEINTFSRMDVTTRQGWVNQVNGTSQPVALILPDGSKLTLMAHSQVSYPHSFEATKREIHLQGEALFSVVHQSTRPFLVYSGTLVTRVLGTRFRVQARPGDSQQKVSVLSGKVSVMDQKDWSSLSKSPGNTKTGVILTVNQQVTYNADHHSYQKALVPSPVVLPVAMNSPETFSFDDTPAAQVFDRLKKAYGIEIIYDESALRHCTLTASLSGVALFDQLQLLCASIGATYEIVDARIIITAKGCA